MANNEADEGGIVGGQSVDDHLLVEGGCGHVGVLGIKVDLAPKKEMSKLGIVY